MSTNSENQVFRVVIKDNDEIDVSYEDENSQDGENYDITEMVLVDNENNADAEDGGDDDNDGDEDDEEEIVEHVCKKCNKTFLDLNVLKTHLPFCRQNSAASLIRQEMYKNIKQIEEKCLKMEIEDKLCYCCEENYDLCHAGHIRCPECPKSFKNSSSFQRHMFLIHSDLDKYPCEICNARCPSKEILRIHTEHHQKRGKPFACKKCGKEFTRRYHVQRHIKFSGCDTATAKKEFECNVCNKVFYRVDNLRSHLRTHLGEDTKTRDYQCPYCDKSFYGTSTLNIHIRTHTGEKPFPCDLCPKVFPSNAALRKHRRYHTGEKPYQCSICSRSFTAKEVLNRHVKTHTGERPHSCSVCGKSFIQATQLRNHLKSHNNDISRGFECALCDQKFNRKSKLSKHLVVDHSSIDVEFKCKQCEETFVSSAGLKRHVTRKHTGKSLTCAICNEEFTDQNSLNFHRLTHTETEKTDEILPIVTLNKCSICYENFTTALGLKRHIKRIHKDVEERTPRRNPSRILNGIKSENDEGKTNVVKIMKDEVIEEYVIEELTSELHDNPNTMVIYEEKTPKNVQPRNEISDTITESQLNDNSDIEMETENDINDNTNQDEDDDLLLMLEADPKTDIELEFEASIKEDENFNNKIRKLLDFLVDTKTLKKFGWPKASIEDVLRKVILNCGHTFTKDNSSDEYITRMREYVKLLFTVVVDSDSIKELLNNLTVDEVIDQVISMADDD